LAVKIGAYDPRQGVLDFVRAGGLAAKGHPDLHLVVLGACSELETVWGLAAELGISERLHILGQRSDVPRILSVFDIYVQSSYFEGMSIGMLEALAAGLPMVTTRVDGVADVLPAGEGALVADIGDYIALASHIAYLVDRPDARRELATTSHLRVRTQFNADTQIAEWTKVYAELQ
jgi:glycosyltransferase involved in cell wall biosynthesis